MRTAGTPRRVANRLLASVAATILAASCGTPQTQTPTPHPSPSAAIASPSAVGSATPTPNPSDVYAQIEDQVVAIRGLQPKSAVDPQVLDPTELKKHIEDSFNKDNPPALVDANEQLLKGMGLVPPDASLADLFIEMQSSQVAGFYDPDAKELYVVSKTGTLGPTERVTFAHEFTHALQDQNFDLKALDLTEVGEGDRGLGRLSLIEGDATAVMSVWAQQNLNTFELLQLSQEAADPEALRILESLPSILRETTLFPYQQGLQFVLSLEATGGEDAVDQAFEDPPASTEQILHFDKYESHEKPVSVSVPKGLAAAMGPGWKLSLQDTFGEFQTGIWLRSEGSAETSVADAAAAGWGGDRIVLLEGPNHGWAIGWLTAWDTAADAAEFRSAAAQAIDAYHIPAATLGALQESRQTIALASDEAGLKALERALGLP
jgi:hypothetical protein